MKTKTKTKMKITDNETKTIISKRNYMVLIVADIKCSCLSVLLVCATQRTANCVALTILVDTYQLINDIGLPASVFTA